MRLTPAEGLGVSWREHAVEVAAGGHLSLPVLVTSEGERVYGLEARLTIEGQDQPVTETLQLFSVGPGGLVVQSDGKSARIESDGLRLTVAAKRGVVTLTDKATRQMLANFGPTMGPPYSSTEMHRREFSVAVEQVGSRAVVQLAAESKAQPGLVLRERVTVAPTGLVEASGWLENHGEQTREAAVRLMVGRVA